LGGLQFEARLTRKKPHLNQWLDVVEHTCHPSYSGSVNRMIEVHTSLGIKEDPISKITRKQKELAQVVECLPTKFEALNSTSTANKYINTYIYNKYIYYL
jgi:hypothetical protein